MNAFTIFAIGIAILFFVFRAIHRHFNKPKPAGVFVQMKCPHCGWAGKVGKYDVRCRQCGSTDV